MASALHFSNNARCGWSIRSSFCRSFCRPFRAVGVRFIVVRWQDRWEEGGTYRELFWYIFRSSFSFGGFGTVFVGQAMKLFMLDPASRLIQGTAKRCHLAYHLPSTQGMPLRGRLLVPLRRGGIDCAYKRLFLVVYRRGRNLILAAARDFCRVFRRPTIMRIRPVRELIRGGRLEVLRGDANRRRRALLTAKRLRRVPIFRVYGAGGVRPPFADHRLLKAQAFMRPREVV